MNDWTNGLQVSRDAEDLRELLNEFLNLYLRAAKAFPQTGERWYLEHSLTSLLIAAGWRLNIPCLAEVKTTRSGTAGDSGGRADVLISLKGAFTAIEAKIFWFDDKGGFETVLGNLKTACSEASTLGSQFATRRIGLCFGVLEKGGTEIEQLLSEARERIETEALDIAAWSVSISSEESVLYPGCFVVGRIDPDKSADSRLQDAPQAARA